MRFALNCSNFLVQRVFTFLPVWMYLFLVQTIFILSFHTRNSVIANDLKKFTKLPFWTQEISSGSLSICPEFFSRTARRNLLIFTQAVINLESGGGFFEKKILFVGFLAKSAKHAPKLSFFKFYEKLKLLKIEN